MSINEEELKKWIEQVTKKLAHLEANQIAIINGDFCDTNTEPKEPLIKDEKIRKAVRAWAEANEETEAKVKGACLVTVFKGLHKQLDLELNCSWTRDGVYTIAELCGTLEPIEPKFIDLDERIKEKEGE